MVEASATSAAAREHPSAAVTHPGPGPGPSLRPKLVLLVVGLGTLLSAASGSTVNLALPDIGRALGVAIDLAGWVVASFLLATTVLLLVAGRLGDLLGHRRIYLIGFTLFGAASLVSGLAQSLPVLLAARLAQGAGGALVAATGPALLTTSFPASERGRALGQLATATYLGLTIGPPVGGWVVGQASWRWVFFVNLPAAAIVVVLGWLYLPGAAARARRERAEPSARRFDWAGALTSIVGLPLVLLAIGRGQRLGWSHPMIVGAAALGLASLAAFVVVERRVRTPLLDLALFRSRVFTGAALSAFANYVALFISIMLLPYYLLEARQIGPSTAGIVLTGQSVLMALSAAPAGRLSDRWGSRGLATLGLGVLALGLAGLALRAAAASVVEVAAWHAATGLGTGLFISPNSSALMGSAPRAQQGVAGAVMATARSMGMTVGVAIGTSVFVAAGGQTGRSWTSTDLAAMRVALLVAAAVALVGAAAAALRGSSRSAPAVL